MSDKRIGFLIKQVFHMNQVRLNEMFAEFDLTGAQTFTLIYLFKAHDQGRIINQRDIERDMDISNPTVTGILNRLENKGLIIRKVNPADARVKNIDVYSVLNAETLVVTESALKAIEETLVK